MKSRIRQRLVEGLRLRAFQSARLGAVLAVAILAACNDTTGPTRFVTITPASQIVAMQTAPTGRVLRTSVTLTNTSTFPITWDYCALTLEKKIEGIIELADGPQPPWFTVWSPICALLSADAVARMTSPLRPGGSVTIPIDVPVIASGSLHFDGSPGQYRIHLLLAANTVGQRYDIIPHDLSISDPFTVTAQ